MTMPSAAIKGFWWRPGEPEKRWFGVLEQTGSEIHLTCHSDTGPIPLVDVNAGNTVHGRDEKGRPVTLLVVSQSGHSQSGGMETVVLNSGYVLIGIHAPDRQSLKAKAVNVRIQQLYGWLGLTGFSRRLNTAPAGKVTISYELQSQQSFLIGSSGEKVCFGLDTNQVMQFQSQKIDEEATVTFESDVGFDFQQVFALTTAMRTLLHFAILKPVYAVSMGFRNVTVSGNNDAPDTGSVEVWSKSFREPMTELPVESLWVFRYDDFAASFGDFFGRWLMYRDKQEEALDCYTTTIYSSLTSQTKNLCLTQALDAYHGVLCQSHGQPGFKKKVEDLCELSKSALTGLVEDITSFARQVRDTRDYLTHHNPEDLAKRDVATGSTALIRLNEKLSILFQSLVLTDIGVPSDRMIRLRRRIATDIVEY